MFHRLLINAALFTAVASSAFAQIPPAANRDVMVFTRAMPAFGSAEGIKEVQSALNLSDVQAAALKTLLDMRTEAMKEIARESADAHTKLVELSAQNNPNSAEVGAAYLAARNSQLKTRAASEKFHSDFEALLSADQRAALLNLKASSARIDSLQRLGILEPSSFAGPLPIPDIVPFGGVGGGIVFGHSQAVQVP